MGGGWSLRRHPAAAAGGSSASAHETSIQEAAPLPRSFAPSSRNVRSSDRHFPPSHWMDVSFPSGLSFNRFADER